MELQPISFIEAAEFIRRHHRHHIPSIGWKFGLAASLDDQIVGVAVIGRPVSRIRDDGWTLELTRLCTDGTKNASSFLLGATRRAVFALGYRRLITYTLYTEPGTSLRAAGWKEVTVNRGGLWSRPGRPRVDKAPTCQKVLWEAVA